MAFHSAGRVEWLPVTVSFYKIEKKFRVEYIFEGVSNDCKEVRDNKIRKHFIDCSNRVQVAVVGPVGMDSESCIMVIRDIL